MITVKTDKGAFVIDPSQIEVVQGKIIEIIDNNGEIRDYKQKQLLQLEKQRLNQICDQYGYNGLSDIQLYASKNDQEAQAILNWYQAYDDAIWNWLDNELTNISDLNQLLQLDLKAVEQQIFDQSIQTAPLPPNEE